MIAEKVEVRDPRSYFKDVPFIVDGESDPVPDTTAFLFNRNGQAVFLPEPSGTQILVNPDDPGLSRGQYYGGVTFTEKPMDQGTQWAYTLIEFDFHTAPTPVIYQPLWADADKRNCQAFGATLVRDGECIAFQYKGLIDSPARYGLFAGYQSPYIGKDRERELLAVNATDLEYHDFPHVFSSMDTEPLVVSVARWRPSRREILLADLWIRPTDLLYLTPKKYSDEYVDMHGDRNSAFACWGVQDKPSLMTRTALDPNIRPQYHEEKTHTIHTRPA
ncbi:MAG TPA: hypothetical protein VGQ36_13070 [Thermoanaerobaculia bacterium]|jgi:hypothetical protein|nr:hypothetical protein [Thermoanaerobaculia bacterium]